MPQTRHTERHFTAGETVRDVVIGMSDGLTVPFALAAGLTGIANASPGIIVTAGLAEIAAGSIAMGLGGYLAAKSDAEHYAKEREREKREVKEIPDEEKREVAQVFHSYGLSDEESEPIVEALAKHPQKWVDFMMRFELGLEKPDPKRALVSAFTIAVSYVAGGLIPLAPYIFADFVKQMSVATALLLSIALTLIALLVFGFIKGRYTGTRPLRSALQTALIGSVAAGAAFLIARLIS
jgi:VIT1/CCC1 family predicted Fe2+/Mn2+ transporter